MTSTLLPTLLVGVLPSPYDALPSVPLALAAALGLGALTAAQGGRGGGGGGGDGVVGELWHDAATCRPALVRPPSRRPSPG